MKKKITLVATSVLLVAAMVIGGTLAYFTDTDQANNTMTIGDVAIEIRENAKNANGDYVDYVQDAILYPVSNDEVFSDLNKHYNKIVRTFNTSPSENAAYIRTIVLFEKNDLLDANYVGDPCECGIPGLHFAYVDEPGSGACADKLSSRGSQSDLQKFTVSIDNNEYWVVVFTDAEEKPIPYEDSLHTLNAVWMDKNITQDQIAGWYNDANGDGDYDDEGDDKKVDIIVFSQGIQSYDLTHAEAMAALGELNRTNIESWITP